MGLASARARQTPYRNAVRIVEEHPTSSHGLTRCDCQEPRHGKHLTETVPCVEVLPPSTTSCTVFASSCCSGIW
eukprot:1747644-Karenia_brevis.AAC.1